MWSTLKGRDKQLKPTLIWPRYRNWQDFKAAIITLSDVRENMLIMNEKMGDLKREIVDKILKKEEILELKNSVK